MKAEKTRELIDKSIDMVFGWTKKSNKTLHDLCVSTDLELTELERLAEIGKATEFAYKKGFLIHDDFYQLPDAESLLNWYRAKE